MILARLVIRDYKQFVGQHEFVPESQGVIAIIGANGAGKTTLFEAVEWCLYAPRSITSAEVFPRGREGRPQVQVTLEHPQDGHRYVIERQLTRSKSMQALVWREDDPEHLLATGSASVRSFVADKLIGLRHDAFVATFFTRQKELTFFGTLRATERRVMVGRLLGVETVRMAQESIGQDRARIQAQAEGLAAQFEQEQQGIDFDAEIARIDEQITIATTEVARADARFAATQQLLEQATRQSDLVRRREIDDRAFADKLGHLAARAGSLRTEARSLTTERERLDQDRERRQTLVIVAADLLHHRQAVAFWRDELENRNRRDDLQRQYDTTSRERTAALAAASQLVRDSQTSRFPDWQWDDRAPVIPALDALIDLGASVRIDIARADAESLTRLAEQHQERTRIDLDLERYQRRLDQLQQEVTALNQHGPIDRAIARSEHDLEQAQTRQNAATGEARQLRAQAEQLVPLLESLKHRHFGNHCPTCGRDIAPGDADSVITNLDKQITTLRSIASARERDAHESQQQAEQAKQERAQLLATREQLTDRISRIETGHQHLEEKRSERERVQRLIVTAMQKLGRTTPPELSDLETAQVRVRETERLIAAVQGLRQLRTTIMNADRKLADLDHTLEQLRLTTYDEAAHHAAEADLDRATRAEESIARIDTELARLPALLERLDQITAEMADLADEETGVQTDRAALRFNPDEVKQAQVALNRAHDEERQALTQQHETGNSLREWRNLKTGYQAEQRRIDDLFARSVSSRREADQLDRMYREFAAFDQFVASRLAPRLAEQTGELLALVTDGKYDRVEFDDDYGIRVYDGAEEHFALDGFSGGERDVVALCARLALSQVIGSSAQNPPSFLVLDEAFGALDRDRRAQLLDLLGQLSEQTVSFQQMFVISHVDDVRSSPIFSRVLRIVEDPDGGSRIEEATALDGDQ